MAKSPLRLLEAFGESKSVAAWARDPRCRVSICSIWHRLRDGWSLERAMTVLLKEERHLDAFGELKSVEEWSRDPRCVVSRQTLRERVKRGEPLEKAMTRPAVSPRTYAPRDNRTWRAFGEFKTAAQWARDPRCRVGSAALARRLDAGVDPETAVTSPRTFPRHVFSAFGETRELAAWARDPRAAVSHGTILARLDLGWDFVQALTTPSLKPGPRGAPVRRSMGKPKTRVPGGKAERMEAFGERKTLREWAADRRCVVNYLLLRDRLSRDWPLERAIVEFPPVGHRNVEAFGEWKSLCAWARDPRCLMSQGGLRYRMDRGESLEEAMTRPPENQRRRRYFDWEPSFT